MPKGRARALCPHNRLSTYRGVLGTGIQEAGTWEGGIVRSQVLRVDLGQTGTRGFLPDGRPFSVPVGLQYGDTVAVAVDRALSHLAAQAADVALLSVSGMRGFLTGVADVASVVRTRSGAREIGICDDGVAWNLGALDGQDGVILAAGGGVVAIGRAGSRLSHVDGCGADLGDDGGASWLGREAIRAAIRSAQNRDRRTSLVVSLEALVGPVLELPLRYLPPAQLHETYRRAAPVVLAEAEQDAVAADIRELGAHRLAASAVSAASIHESTNIRFSLCGGLMHDDAYRTAVQRGILAAVPGAEFHAPVGDALDGLVLLPEHFPDDKPPLVEWVRY